MLGLPRLRLLSELHRLGTLSEVARTLSYSPSAVSQQLAVLEREAGARLVEKDGRRVRLTDAGLALVERADAILELLERAESDLAATRTGPAGVLRAAALETALLSLARPALDLLARDHPDLQVRFSGREVEAAYAALFAHEVDVLVGEEYPGLPDPRRPGVDRSELIADRLLLVLPPEGRWSDPSRVADLADAPFALDPADTTTGAWARAALRERGIEPNVHFESFNPLLQLDLVRSGHAVALIPALMGADRLRGTRLRTLPEVPRRRLFTAVRAGRADHPAVRAFRAALLAVALEVDVDAPVPVLPA